MENGLFLRNLWYFALHGEKLRKGRLLAKEIVGEKIVFGRASDGSPFALRDNCAHRGVPLSEGTFDGETIRCCYHGWEFNCAGTCQKIPALANGSVNLRNIKVYSYPCKEVNGTVWVYVPYKKSLSQRPEDDFPDLLVPPDKRFVHVETILLPTSIDHAVIGLVDPAHVTFVHQSWFWRTAKTTRVKEKRFEPVGLGFKMVRHEPSVKTTGYSLLGGARSTEIIFQLPGYRLEHIQIGASDTIVSITVLTPVNENLTELNQIVYSSLKFTQYLSWPLKQLGKAFLDQDANIFKKLSKGLQNEPKLMLLGDPDTQARWYFELKDKWRLALEQETQFHNPLKPQTLQWIT
jgi:phenylpropionate dioxygenase-like ring-hydroxylating dioxygenase large terminal subunit